MNVLCLEGHGYRGEKTLSFSLRLRVLLQRLRIQQVRFCSDLLVVLGRSALASRGLTLLRQLPLTRRLLEAVVGYKRPFASLEQAQTALSRFGSGGHGNPDNASLHLALARKPRTSDYAALYHLRLILPDVRRVFDLGGNVGNLYYCYEKYLEFASDLVWQVYDVPEMLEIGQRLALERGDTRLRFTDSLRDGEGCDLLLASGSLHYFAKPLGDIVAEWKQKPKYILVNRTPLADGAGSVTVQDARTYRVACNIFRKADLIESFERAGYAVADSWQVEELSIRIPCYPELSVPAYTGLFLRACSEGREYPHIRRIPEGTVTGYPVLS